MLAGEGDSDRRRLSISTLAILGRSEYFVGVLDPSGFRSGNSADLEIGELLILLLILLVLG